jgi:hypothetical protein
MVIRSIIPAINMCCCVQKSRRRDAEEYVSTVTQSG